MYLTKKQREVYNFIRQFIDDNGYAPSFDEIGRALKLSSLATVHKHIANLEKKGAIKRSPNKSRSIELEMVPFDPNTVRVNIMGIIAAGQPIEAIEHPEQINIPEQFLKSNEVFVLRVKGDSMIDEQIRHGDLIIVERRNTAENGDTVVALINDSEATVKKFYREKEQIRLQPANESMKPILVDPAKVKIQGVVIGLMRKF